MEKKKKQEEKKALTPLRKTISCAILLFVLCHLLPVLEGTGLGHPLGYYTRALFRIIFIIFLFFFLLVALFNPASRKIRRSEIDGSPGRRWRQCCLMMTFKCGAASFDCSRVARRDVFLRFSFSCFCRLSLSIFHFLVNILFSSFYPFRISRSDRK